MRNGRDLISRRVNLERLSLRNATAKALKIKQQCNTGQKSGAMVGGGGSVAYRRLLLLLGGPGMGVWPQLS